MNITDDAYKGSHVIESLSPHQLESGMVTQHELDVARRWSDGITAPEDAGWLDGWLGQDYPFSFKYGGTPSTHFLRQWSVSTGEHDSGSDNERQEITWTDKNTGLKVSWELKRYADFPAVEWVLTFENTSSHDTPILEEVQALDLRLCHTQVGRSYTVHGTTGGRSLPDDMIPFSRQVPGGTTWWNELQLGGEHPSSNNHLPFFNIETPEQRGVIVGIGWSGNWVARVRVEDTELRTRAGLKETHFVLRPGERVRTPRILLLFWQDERLHGNNMLRRLLHQHHVPKLRGRLMEPLTSVNLCFTHHGEGGYLHQATEKSVLALAQPFGQLGAELFVIDAGWYDGEPWQEWMGNWRYSKAKYPRGFRPVADALAVENMPLGIWFASEMVTKHAPVLEEHAEWVRWREADQYGSMRMELPEVRNWFLSQVDDLMRHEGMACYRQDGSAWYDDEPADRKGISESQHITGLYDVWDALLKRYPGIIMEGCSGGGRRIDLETLSRFHWHQKSDRWYDSESDQCSLYGANLYLPGGVINIPTQAIDNYGAWSSFAGQFCLGWHPLDVDFPNELARQQVERYKRIRPLLSGDFYPLTPCSLDANWLGYQFHRFDLNQGFALLFRRYKAGQVVYPVDTTFLLRLRGLEPEASYRVHLESADTDQVFTSNSLAQGITIAIDSAPGAELIQYERIH